MITVKQLRKILDKLPDNAELTPQEDSIVGIRVMWGDRFGWIETGYDIEDADEKKHSLEDVLVRLPSHRRTGKRIRFGK